MDSGNVGLFLFIIRTAGLRPIFLSGCLESYDTSKQTARF